MKGDIYALNCAGCLTPQFVYGGDLKHYQINDDDHLYKTYCPSCKRIMLVPALTSFMNVVHMAPRPPFVPYVPKSPAAAIPAAGPAASPAQPAQPAQPAEQDIGERLWDEAVARSKERAMRIIKAMNKPYNPVDEDEDSESDDELGWGS